MKKSPMGAKSSRSRRKASVHFGMVVILFVAMYRAFHRPAIITTTSAADSFEPNNIAKVDRIPCGKEKCFFRLKSDSQLGYLVSRTEDREDRRERFETLEAGWKLAQSLEEDYDIQHFLAAPPKIITVSSKLEPCLNRNLWSEKFEKKWKKGHKRFPKGSKAYIQMVHAAPKQTLLIGCSNTKVVPFKNHVKPFLQEVKYKESFARRFKENIAQARTILEKESCMTKDFQVLVDIKGQVYHLDFDRCFMPDDASTKYTITQEETASCLEILGEIENEVNQNLAEIK